MILRIQLKPFVDRSDRLIRLIGASAVGVGVTTLLVWDPLTHPGPKVCLLRYAVGLPCPLCGMTRGVSLCLRGHFHEASHFNPLAGPVLILSLVLAVKWAIEIFNGGRFEAVLPRWLKRGCVHGVYVLLIANWIYLILFRREDPFFSTWVGQLWSILGGG
jgi:hypothetical protein